MSKVNSQRNNVKWSTLALVFTLVISLVTPAILFAAEGDEQLVLEEIIVTAQKRGEERLIDVPISISVVNEKAIRDLGLQTIGDLAFTVPSLSVFEITGLPGQQKITMRGIGADSGLNSTVGYYWDEIPVNTQGLPPEGTTLDTNRVEVLRGPQGTLFGEGSMGGTIRVISNRPDLSEFGGSFIGGYSGVEHGDEGGYGTAVLNLPVVEDVFGIRIAGEIREEPGYIDNIQLGQKDANDRKLTQLRGKALWQVNDEITADFTYYHYDSDIGAPSYVDDLDTLTVSTFREVEAFSEVDAFNAVVEFDLGFANLLSSSSYTDRSQNQPNASGDGVNSLVVTEAELGGDDFSQELRLTSNSEGRLHWTFGGFFSTHDSEQPIFIEVIQVIPGGGAALGLPGTDLKIHVTSDNALTSTTDSWSAFGEISYDITDRLTGTVGASYYQTDYDWTNASVNTTTLSVLLGGIPLFEIPAVSNEFNTPSGEDDSINPKFNLNYSLGEDAMVYFNVAKGFRAGGVNLILDVPKPDGGFVRLPESFGPESLWTYEVGSKALLDDGRWMIEGAAYYTDWTDLQAVFCPFENAPVCGTNNQGAATVYGIEAMTTFLPIPTLTLTANAGYTDASFDDATPDHNAGDPVPYVPEITLSAAMFWRPEIGSEMNALVSLDYSYRDEVYRVSLINLGYLESDSFNFFNAKIGIEKETWGAYLVGRNLTDDQGAAGPILPGQAGQIVPVRPRMLGVEFSARF